MDITPVAKIYNDFPTKFGLPRQSGMSEHLVSKIVMEKQYQNFEAFRGIEEFEYLWLLWEFEPMGKREWSPTVRPPKLGGNIRKGVFATRSPNRPNPIGLTKVRLLSVEQSETDGPVLYVAGADLMSGTAIFDIKPYLPFADSAPDAAAGDYGPENQTILSVEIPPQIEKLFGEEQLVAARTGIERVAFGVIGQLSALAGRDAGEFVGNACDTVAFLILPAFELIEIGPAVVVDRVFLIEVVLVEKRLLDRAGFTFLLNLKHCVCETDGKGDVCTALDIIVRLCSESDELLLVGTDTALRSNGKPVGNTAHGPFASSGEIYGSRGSRLCGEGYFGRVERDARCSEFFFLLARGEHCECCECSNCQDFGEFHNVIVLCLFVVFRLL